MLTEPVQDKMFCKHAKLHWSSALYLRLSGSVGELVWSKKLSFRLEFAGGASSRLIGCPVMSFCKTFYL